MEERIDLIKKSLKGDRKEDIAFLNAMLATQNRIVDESLATIEAINTVLKEINEENIKNDVEENTEDVTEESDIVQEDENKEPQEEKSPEEIEIDNLIDELTNNLDKEDVDEALKSIEEIIPRIENISKTDDENVLYCSFSSDFEKMIFENIFANEKEVRNTPYANDIVYILYSDILLKKKRRKAAMDALDRAIYWNFLNREARSKKIDLYFDRKEFVKCLDAIKKLQMISYTARDIADCYNKYAYVFNSLKDKKSAYALYRLSYNYFENPNVRTVYESFEKEDPTLKELSLEDIVNIAQENEVEIGPNSKIIKAHRDITTKLIEAGAIQEAKIMIQNDYAMTREDAIAKIYDQLLELEESENNNTEDKVKEDENHQQKKRVAKKKSSTSSKTTTKRATKPKEEKKGDD